MQRDPKFRELLFDRSRHFVDLHTSVATWSAIEDVRFPPLSRPGYPNRLPQIRRLFHRRSSGFMQGFAPRESDVAARSGACPFSPDGGQEF
jgi:hypothetical protein